MEPFRTTVTIISGLFLFADHVLGIELNLFSRRTFMENKIFLNGLIEEVSANTASNCVLQCVATPNCNYGLYNRDVSKCRLYNHDNNDDLTADSTGYQSWGLVECETPVSNNDQDVLSYSSTTYMSTARYRCGLGYYSMDGIYEESVCQIDGQWSAIYMTCLGIPKLKGTKALGGTPSGSAITCRNEISIASTGSSEYASCNADEILTGCSSRNVIPGSPETGGTALRDGMCRSMYNGDQAIARCCRIPGLQCEYFRNTTKDTSASCYKDFQLLDCACFVSDCACVMDDVEGVGPCPNTPTNHTCIADPNYPGWRYALCCTHKGLDCYVKVESGQDNPGDSQLTIRCGPGEAITACSGYNTGAGIQEAIVEDIGGVETCVVKPGSSTFDTMVGHVSCCKYK